MILHRRSAPAFLLINLGKVKKTLFLLKAKTPEPAKTVNHFSSTCKSCSDFNFETPREAGQYYSSGAEKTLSADSTSMRTLPPPHRKRLSHARDKPNTSLAPTPKSNTVFPPQVD